MALTVQDFYKDKSADLQLELLAGSEGLKREISVSELNRPALALGGFFENFRWERVQVIGRGEHAYLNHVVLKKTHDTLKDFFKFKIPCIILTHHQQPRPELLELSSHFQVPFFVSGLETASLVAEL